MNALPPYMQLLIAAVMWRFVVTDYLLENDGDRLKKMLMALATIEVVPNTIYLDEKLTPDLEPADARYWPTTWLCQKP